MQIILCPAFSYFNSYVRPFTNEIVCLDLNLDGESLF